MKIIWSFSGSGPIETGNSWNSPGLIPAPAAAVKVSLPTTSVTWLPCTFSGVASLRFSTATVQPGTGMVDTDATGASSGRFTSSLTVDAVSLSFGTRNATRPYPPWVAEFGLTVTCANAGPAMPSATTTRADAEGGGLGQPVTDHWWNLPT